jgi:hypothetical protein
MIGLVPRPRMRRFEDPDEQTLINIGVPLRR